MNASNDQAGANSAPSFAAEIIAVGTEILLGNIENTNATWLSRELAALGVNLYRHSVTGDNALRLEETLRHALSRSNLIITTGGLGPTYDDITKDIVCQVTGQKATLHQESLERIQSYFDRINGEMTENNIRQAMLPDGCTVFPNDRGTAPGCAVETEDGKIIIVLPGPPAEMKYMFDQSVRPFLAARSPFVIVSRTVCTYGIGESALDAILPADIRDSHNPSVAPYANLGEVRLRVTAKAATLSDAQALIDPMVARLRELLADFIYGVDALSLEDTLVSLLTQREMTIAVAESCTGGYLAKRITDIPGASKVFSYGAITYSDKAKIRMLGVSPALLQKYTAVSRQAALAMADGIRARSGADLGVAVTGYASPTGDPDKPAGLIYVAVSDGARRLCHQLPFRVSGREFTRYLAASQALNLARKFALHTRKPCRNQVINS